MSKALILAAAIMAVLAAAGIAVALLASRTDNGAGMGGMGSTGMQTPSTFDTVLIVLSLVALAVAIVLVVLGASTDRNRTQTHPQSLPPIPTAPSPRPIVGTAPDEPVTTAPEADKDAGNPEDLEGQPRNYLILRLLTDDEKMIYKTIMDAGGSALQKDLIITTRMSKAKVTRVLDKLQSKGLVTRERHASTNLVKIKA
jgi:hypothetical protein